MHDAHGGPAFIAVARVRMVRYYGSMKSITLRRSRRLVTSTASRPVTRKQAEAIRWKAKALERWENEGGNIPQLRRPAWLDKFSEALGNTIIP